ALGDVGADIGDGGGNVAFFVHPGDLEDQFAGIERDDLGLDLHSVLLPAQRHIFGRVPGGQPVGLPARILHQRAVGEEDLDLAAAVERDRRFVFEGGISIDNDVIYGDLERVVRVVVEVDEEEGGVELDLRRVFGLQRLDYFIDRLQHFQRQVRETFVGGGH